MEEGEEGEEVDIEFSPGKEVALYSNHKHIAEFCLIVHNTHTHTLWSHSLIMCSLARVSMNSFTLSPFSRL